MTVKEFWLHVLDDGSELAFDPPPYGLKCLRVKVQGRWEITYTYNVTDFVEHGHYSIDVKRVVPRGTGWQYYGAHDDGCSTAWRRKATGIAVSREYAVVPDRLVRS